MKDLTNQRFGKLVVLRFAERRRAYKDQRWVNFWSVKCDCGKEYEVNPKGLLNGTTKSCGCKRADSNTKHGHALKNISSKAYTAWINMRKRCEDTSYEYFHRYGGRGIKVCDRWQDFSNFLSDMGEPSNKLLSLERVNRDGDYEPSNCVWTTQHYQTRNTIKNIMITFNGKTQCLEDWAEEVNIRGKTLSYRIKKGWDLERALTTPAAPYVPPHKRKYPSPNSSSAQVS